MTEEVTLCVSKQREARDGNAKSLCFRLMEHRSRDVRPRSLSVLSESQRLDDSQGTFRAKPKRLEAVMMVVAMVAINLGRAV